MEESIDSGWMADTCTADGEGRGCASEEKEAAEDDDDEEMVPGTGLFVHAPMLFFAAWPGAGGAIPTGAGSTRPLIRPLIDEPAAAAGGAALAGTTRLDAIVLLPLPCGCMMVSIPSSRSSSSSSSGWRAIGILTAGAWRSR